MWKTLYDSPLWLPILPTAIAFVVLGVTARSRHAALHGRFVASVAVLAAADAWLGGPWSPLSSPSALATASAVFFVIAGDLRYFLAVRLGVLPLRKAFVRATAIAFVMPLVSQLAVRVPFPHAPERVVFFTYELGMLTVITIDALRIRRDASSRALLRFELVQYALWASADAVLLSGFDGGYLLRIVPNVLYYCAFAPFAAWALRSRFPTVQPTNV